MRGDTALRTAQIEKYAVTNLCERREQFNTKRILPLVYNLLNKWFILLFTVNKLLVMLSKYKNCEFNRLI